MVENCDLTSLATWLGSSRLYLNVDKSNSMLIGSCQRISDQTLSVSVGESVLSQVHSVRYLGVLIDSTVSGLGPYHQLCCVYYVLYSAFVMPLFDYCDVIWTPSRLVYV